MQKWSDSAQPRATMGYMDLSDLLSGRPELLSRSALFQTCRARSVLTDARLDEETDASVWQFIDDPTKPATRLSRYLADNGIPISTSAIWRHRRRECACANPKDHT